MPQTPTDPTKAQVWVTGEAPNQQLEFYIPRGAKGEPGGITLGTVLGTANLDDIKTSGVYRQTAAANSTPLNNYPEASLGVLLVYEVTATTHLEQEFRPFWFSPTTRHASVFYRRQFVSGVWSAWKVYPSNRVSETAGRAIYQWDNINHREQLIYGDTGLRNLEAEIINGWTATIFKVRRIGYEVTMYFYNVSPAAQTGASMWTIPVGFRPPSAVTTMSGTLTGGNVQMTSIAVQPYTSASSATGTVQLVKYATLDAWPATLPGTASGTVPFA